MDRHFTTDPLETLDEWNTVLSYGCCCEMPSCPIPTIDCQTKTGSYREYLWLPFVKPDGEDDERVPRLYKDRAEKWNESWQTGWAWLYQGWNENPTAPNEWAEVLQNQQLQGSVSTAGRWEWWQTGNLTLADTGAHASPIPITTENQTGLGGYRNFDILFTISAGVPAYDTGASDSVTEVAPETSSMGETFYQHDGAVMRYVKGSGPLSLQGAGGADYVYTHSWDVEEHVSERYENSDAVTTETARNEAMDDSGPWDDPPEGTGDDTTACSSYHNLIEWPLIGDFSPWPDPATLPPLTSLGWKDWAEVNIRDVRYRWKIPHTWTGSYFKITWDVLTEPDGWDATIDDPDYVPPDPLPDPPPPIPQVPKPGRPSRSYVRDLTVEWIGPGTGDEDDPSWFTPWNDLNPPPEPGTRRIVNIRFECYHSPYGTKPQLTGEGVDLTEDTPLQKQFTSKRHAINLTTTT